MAAYLLGGVPLFLYDLLTYQSTPAITSGWMKLFVRFHNTATNAAPQDDAMITFDIMNFTGGNVDDSWTTPDFTTCESAFDTFFTALKPNMSTLTTVSEYRWYHRHFNDLSSSKPFQDSGPPVRVTTKAITGTGATTHATQVAFSVTEKTSLPKHWGRFYLPLYGMSVTASTFRWSSANTDTPVTLTKTLYDTLQAAEFFPVVPVTQINKEPARALLNVTQIQADDIPDVIRHRRLRNVLYRKVLP